MDNPYYERLVHAAIRYASFRPHSEKEMHDFLYNKLKKWEVSGDLLIEKVITRMRELGYVDDEKFAIWWVSQRTNFKAKGNRMIELELQHKGVTKKTILAALGGRNSLEAARKAIGRKHFKTPQQCYNFLARRGFDADTIKKVQYEL